MRPFVPAVLVVLLLVPTVPADQDGHRVLVVDDMADGRTYVGAYATFGVLVLDGDGAPLPHQDVRVEVVQGDRVLYGLGPAQGHDYDGVQEFQVRFDRPGPFEVRAESAGVTDVLRGVVEDRPAVEAGLGLEVPDEVVAGEPFDVWIRPRVDGAVAAHSDAIVQVLDAAGREVLRVHTHTHTEDQVLQVTVPAEGRYTVRAVASTYFADGAAELPQVMAEQQVTAAAASGVVLPRPLAAPGMNPVHEGNAGALRLFGTADPFDTVRVGMPVDLAVTVMDGDAPAEHMDFEAVLEGPDGVLFSSTSLHEYDGVLHVRTLATVPGDHVLRVTAVRGDERGSVEVPYAVEGGPRGLLDAVLGSPSEARLDAPSEVGCGEELVLGAHRADGTVYGHTEVRFEVMQDGLPLRAGKAHTHGDGRFALAFGLDGGDYVLQARLDPTRADAGGLARASDAVPFTVDCEQDDAPLGGAIDARAMVPGWLMLSALLAVVGVGLTIAFLRRPKA